MNQMMHRVLHVTQQRLRLHHHVRYFSDSTCPASSDATSDALPPPPSSTPPRPPGEAHTPVMAREVLRLLQPIEGGTYIDMTFGGGGHSRRLLKQVPSIRLIAVDRDPVAFSYAQQLSEEYPKQVIPLCGRFSELPALLSDMRIAEGTIDGALCDLGCSSMQVDEHRRGFSPLDDGPLDMRMDDNRITDEPTAAEVLAAIDEEDLYKIIKIYGMEKKARKIAHAIIDSRYAMQLTRTTGALATVVASSLEREVYNTPPNREVSAVARTFLALRMFVNNELNEINFAMPLIHRFLKPNGRLVVISYHQLVDAIVKRHINGHVVQGVANALPLKFFSSMETYNQDNLNTFVASPWKPLFKHVIVPSPTEMDMNPMSQSARLRAAAKLAD